MDDCNNENNAILKKLIKDNDKYEKILGFLDDATNDNVTKDKIKESLESYIDGINIVSAYENRKFYEIRF